MNNVQFEEQKYNVPGRNNARKKTGSVVKLILATGLVKDEKQANIVMIGIIVLMTAIFFLINSTGKDNPVDTIDTSVIDPTTNLPYGQKMPK